MYIYQVMKGSDAVEFCEEKLTQADLAKVDLKAVNRVEIYSASIAEDGEDFCEIRVIDSRDTVVLLRRVMEI